MGGLLEVYGPLHLLEAILHCFQIALCLLNLLLWHPIQHLHQQHALSEDKDCTDNDELSTASTAGQIPG